MSQDTGRLAEPVAPYQRNSSEEQRKRQTIDRQRHLIREGLAKWPNLSVLPAYEDEGVSGTIPFKDRPAGRQLMEDAKAGKAKTVIVTSLDRFGRTLPNIVDAQRALEALGVELYVLDSPLGKIDTSEPMGKFAFHLLACVAELERDLIVQRIRTVKDLRAREGKWWGGTLPYGYDLDENGRLVVNDAEAAIVREIFRRAIDGESIMAIARDLNARGIPAPMKRKNGKHRYYARGWAEDRIQNMLNKPLYTGIFPIGDDILQDIPNIVTEKDVQAWQSLRHRRAHMYSDRFDVSGILSGMLRCALCGGVIYTWNNGKNRYYTCHNTRKYHGKPASCKAKLVRQDHLDAFILNHVEHAIAHPERWLNRSTSDKTDEAGDDEIATLEARLTEQKAAYQRLLDFATRGIVTSEAFETQERVLRNEQLETERRLRRVRRHVDGEKGTDATEETQRQAMLVRERWSGMGYAEKKRFVRRVVSGGVVRTIDPELGKKKRAEVEITFRFQVIPQADFGMAETDTPTESPSYHMRSWGISDRVVFAVPNLFIRRAGLAEEDGNAGIHAATSGLTHAGAG